jgi:hypothetical protein
MSNNKKYVSLTRLSNFLDNIKAKYSQIGHKHTTADLTDYKVDTEFSPTSNNPIANSAVNAELDAIADSMGALELAIDGKASITDYNESIIGLSVDGTTVTYIKGDGSVHTFETQDTNTTYSLGTDEVTGLTKLYATTGSAEDGTMTQKAIKTELDKKVGVSIDDSQNTLIFTV